MTNECEVLAGRLSKAQREAVTGKSRIVKPSTWQRLHEIGITETAGGIVRFTPLGEQLQAYIREGE